MLIMDNQSIKCVICRTPLNPTDQFCPKCGTKIFSNKTIKGFELPNYYKTYILSFIFAIVYTITINSLSGIFVGFINSLYFIFFENQGSFFSLISFILPALSITLLILILTIFLFVIVKKYNIKYNEENKLKFFLKNFLIIELGVAIAICIFYLSFFSLFFNSLLIEMVIYFIVFGLQINFLMIFIIHVSQPKSINKEGKNISHRDLLVVSFLAGIVYSFFYMFSNFLSNYQILRYFIDPVFYLSFFPFITAEIIEIIAIYLLIISLKLYNQPISDYKDFYFGFGLITFGSIIGYVIALFGISPQYGVNLYITDYLTFSLITIIYGLYFALNIFFTLFCLIFLLQKGQKNQFLN